MMTPKTIFSNLEWEWQRSKPHYSDKEWLDIFPEARPYLKNRLAELKQKQINLKSEIKSDLQKIYQTAQNDFLVWFREKIIETWWGDELNQVSRDIKKIEWTLWPNDIKQESKLTNEMVQKAREFPFKNLIEFNRTKKALCMFHNEKNPSMSLNPKTNRVKCFACGINLDPIGFIMKTQNMSFINAVKYLNNY